MVIATSSYVYRLATLRVHVLLPFGGSTPGKAKHFLPSGLLPASGGEISNQITCVSALWPKVRPSWSGSRFQISRVSLES